MHKFRIAINNTNGVNVFLDDFEIKEVKNLKYYKVNYNTLGYLTLKILVDAVDLDCPANILSNFEINS